MGCDIHIYREKLIDGNWVTADSWYPCKYEENVSSHEEIGGGRNYALFYCLARVRQNGKGHKFSFSPRGMPLTASVEVLSDYKRWEGDGHSHSFLYLHELEELLDILDKNKVKVIGMKDKVGLQKFRAAIEAGESNCWELIYPYCSWSSDSENYEHFEIEIPASFQVKRQLCEIIEGLKNVGGELQRIVFWFDN
jgi:hypothetical protein